MIATRLISVALLLAVTACTFSSAAAQTALCRLPPVATPGWYDWIFDPGVPRAARDNLLPLYQQLDLLQKLRFPVAVMQMQDQASDFLAALAGARDSKAGAVVERSATGRSRPENAATSANSPEALGWNIVGQIHNLESQIKTVRHKYGLDTTIGPATKAFDISSVFSNDGVKAWLSTSDCGRKLLERTVPPPKAFTSCDWEAMSRQCDVDDNSCRQSCLPLYHSGYTTAGGNCEDACSSASTACHNAAIACLQRKLDAQK